MKLVPLALALAPALLLLPQEPSSETRAPQAIVGQAAPGFRLNDHTGRVVTIDGELPEEAEALFTVVAFYPKAMTPG